MTSSKSNSSILRIIAVLAVLVMSANADAGGRKRIVVLDFEGPKADKFHDDVVKLIKKNHTVVSAEKWNGAAEELGAEKVNEKNIKKVAKKLKIDGVVTGKVEKRRDEYIVQIKLRAGASGELIGNRVDTKAEGPRLDGKASRDVKDELLPAIDELEKNNGGGDAEEDEEKPAKKKKGGDEEEDEERGGFSKGSKMKKGGDEDEEEEDKPAKKSKKEEEEEKRAAAKAKKEAEEEEKAAAAKAKKEAEDEEKAAKKAKKAKKEDDEEEALTTKKERDEEEDTPLPKSKKRPAKKDDDEDRETASADEDGGSVEASSDDEEESGDAATNLSPSERAIDAVVGMSFVARRLTFTYASDLATPPPGYKQAVPVAGALIDATIYPLAFGHKRKDILRGLGITFNYDRVLVINSKKKFINQMGAQAVADIKTSEQKLGFGAVFRYPLGKGPTAMVVGGKLGYSAQTFAIDKLLPNGDPVDIPSVAYKMVEVGGMLRYPVNEKVVANVDAGVLVVMSMGDMQSPDQYGKASVFGFQGAAGIDYALKPNIFIRGSARFERIGMSFTGTGKQTTMRDSDPEKDVSGASDVYWGGTATVGYLY